MRKKNQIIYTTITFAKNMPKNKTSILVLAIKQAWKFVIESVLSY